MAVSETLNARGERYGEFATHAKYTQALKRVLQTSPNWAKMDDDQREALEMVAHKVGRILNGDPNYSDSWHDIAGYATLVDTRLSGQTLTAADAPIDAQAVKPAEFMQAPVKTGVAAPIKQPAETHVMREAPVPATDDFRKVQVPVPASVAPPAPIAPPLPVAVTAPKPDPAE